ncbi:hypothetical protein CLAFUW4_13176 [Fulvia fulva]|uniref:Uncharacterized protein n=1 Tax=Passalora fulva TaxID=5499 RepID=A0A9Q8UV46_PASFU|nr:uncharacterized protein CLAFUR5_13033 [Fulvia fulva]KAK4612123.1 hypothetical protein CLAFUR4_13181 [Fulvia fulva]KAK4612968.1 hypothetical protein CLAFUR0_13185 [Fulvia fulva]UJO23603.1 hypothetical protein CLAFUR5_13033 [Fulvia fulva]WPV21338.1 hypothetical protein CLAFUW4_13176 [Fulvia fulva]WPV36122.1 hypothetical protein CLAFUW7_13184 [Fulvia fulva]
MALLILTSDCRPGIASSRLLTRTEPYRKQLDWSDSFVRTPVLPADYNIMQFLTILASLLLAATVSAQECVTQATCNDGKILCDDGKPRRCAFV